MIERTLSIQEVVRLERSIGTLNSAEGNLVSAVKSIGATSASDLDDVLIMTDAETLLKRVRGRKEALLNMLDNDERAIIAGSL